mmetsp:Transcript_41274/g.104062  ORF Transcript_41274/g.104062 Transcript_41274/m.104062 type:complete len:113 (-) Transcript_41274:37-375(-)
MLRALTQSTLSNALFQGAQPHRRLARCFSEEEVRNKLVKEFTPSHLHLKLHGDGCAGGMLEIAIESPVFRGMKVLQQHRAVKGALAETIAKLHGVTLTTRATPLPDAQESDN